MIDYDSVTDAARVVLKSESGLCSVVSAILEPVQRMPQPFTPDEERIFHDGERALALKLLRIINPVKV